LAEGRNFEFPENMTDDEMAKVAVLVSEHDAPVQPPLPRYATAVMQARAGRSAGCAVAQGLFFLGAQNFSIGLYLYSVKKIKSKWAVFVGLIVNEKGRHESKSI
jgi:hypothetical protein